MQPCNLLPLAWSQQSSHEFWRHWFSHFSVVWYFYLSVCVFIPMAVQLDQACVFVYREYLYSLLEVLLKSQTVDRLTDHRQSAQLIHILDIYYSSGQVKTKNYSPVKGVMIMPSAKMMSMNMCVCVWGGGWWGGGLINVFHWLVFSDSAIVICMHLTLSSSSIGQTHYKCPLLLLFIKLSDYQRRNRVCVRYKLQCNVTIVFTWLKLGNWSRVWNEKKKNHQTLGGNKSQAKNDSFRLVHFYMYFQ